MRVYFLLKQVGYDNFYFGSRGARSVLVHRDNELDMTVPREYLSLKVEHL